MTDQTDFQDLRQILKALTDNSVGVLCFGKDSSQKHPEAVLLVRTSRLAGLRVVILEGS